MKRLPLVLAAGLVLLACQDSPEAVAPDDAHVEELLSRNAIPDGGLLQILKTTNGVDAYDPPGPTIPEGDPVTWEYTVTNVGTGPAVDITITDNVIGEICTIESLAAFETVSCSSAGTAVVGQYVNYGFANGQRPDGSLLTDSDRSHYLGEANGGPLEVAIDLKPGSDPNCVNPGKKGRTPVAILTTAVFDALTVDPATVMVNGVAALRWAEKDVEGDGDIDLIFHFDSRVLADAGAFVDGAEFYVIGSLLAEYDGTPFEGYDIVNIAGEEVCETADDYPG